MPSRISLPKLSLFSPRNPPSSSSSSSSPPPPSSTTSASKMPLSPSSPKPASSFSRRTSTPGSPPARLHLRNILPASPEQPPIMPPPPRTPRAWVWQCHQCLSIYPLGCTRRCLDCSHTYCVSSAQAQAQVDVNYNSGSSRSSSSSSSKKRRRPAVICTAEFDYVGWEQWGSWRRKVLGLEAQGRCEPGARDRAFLRRRHDCWLDCDSPSECCHRRYSLAAEMMRRQLYAPDPPRSPDGDLPPSEALAMPRQQQQQQQQQQHEDVVGDEETPKSPLGQSSFLWDDDETRGDDEEERREEERWWATQSRLGSDQRDGGTISRIPGLGLLGLDADANDGGGNTLERCERRLTVRNFTDDEIAAESESESDSDASSWSSWSLDSDDSSGAGEARRKAS
ncbi:hypothetical protein SAMD00023353_3300480 [Rosellinia necatrix]|uniref:Uncharacterized protein n=1 Tax=Rosellinia necatrix TaxID=77044 RepID=A0A1W2TK76_ROSNE|nr:hypothetical protein SAMD00023353_3300480 [Rosellinia necatrix]